MSGPWTHHPTTDVCGTHTSHTSQQSQGMSLPLPVHTVTFSTLLSALCAQWQSCCKILTTRNRSFTYLNPDGETSRSSCGMTVGHPSGLTPTSWFALVSPMPGHPPLPPASDCSQILKGPKSPLWALAFLSSCSQSSILSGGPSLLLAPAGHRYQGC